MRACQPVADGYVERDGVKVHYELFGAGEPTVLLLPTWSIIHSRHCGCTGTWPPATWRWCRAA
jgi:hypothetical protein